jgi:hypothetical protein
VRDAVRLETSNFGTRKTDEAKFVVYPALLLEPESSLGKTVFVNEHVVMLENWLVRGRQQEHMRVCRHSSKKKMVANS